MSVFCIKNLRFRFFETFRNFQSVGGFFDNNLADGANKEQSQSGIEQSKENPGLVEIFDRPRDENPLSRANDRACRRATESAR